MTGRHAAVVMALLLLLPIQASGEDVDGKTPLVCDLVKVSQCDGVASCASTDFADIDLPPVYVVDFAAKRLASEDGQRTSPIASQELLDAVLLLQGTQNGRGWTMVIDRATGHLSATIADAEGALVIAGACTARPESAERPSGAR
jgi:hypothetical protein